jgi:ligand-binding sensor domain-containing protein/anti-sigma regulatory factor (Ser/Thr protein kinase)
MPEPLSLLAALLYVVSTPAPPAAERLLIRTYTAADGLPGTSVGCLARDRDGFIWICTRNGIARFDGSQFVAFGTRSGLPDPVTNHFLHTRAGSRWVATNGGGVARLEPGPPDSAGRVFTAFAVGSTPRSMRVNVLFEAGDGTFFAGTDGGLFRAASAAGEPVFEPVPLALPGYPDSGLQVWAFAEDSTGGLWVGTSGGLVLIAPGRAPRHFPVAPEQGADHVFAILPDEGGRLWLGHDTGLFVWLPPAPPGEPSRPLRAGAGACVTASRSAAVMLPVAAGAACHWLPPTRAARRPRIAGLLRAANGWIWMTSAAGVLAFDGVAVHVFDDGGVLPTSGVQHIAADPGGDVWIGSRSGAHRILRRGVTHFAMADGDPLHRVLRGPDGHLYAVSAGTIIYRMNDQGWTAAKPLLPSAAGVSGRSIYGAALLDRSGAWWIGTGAGLLRYPPVADFDALGRTLPAAHYRVADGLAGDDVWHLYEDARGDIWIATRVPTAHALTRWERRTGRFHLYGELEGLPQERAVKAFVEDAAGALWVSMWDGGLARYDGARFLYLEPGTDVPPGPRYQMTIDTRGWLWVGGRNVLFTRDPAAPRPRFEMFRTQDGLPLDALALTADVGGWILAGSATGLIRIRDDGRVQQLVSGGPMVSLDNPMHRDDDGTIWLPREEKVIRYIPQPVQPAAAPRVWIGGVRVAGNALPVPSMGATTLPEVRLRYGQRQVQIEWFGLGFGGIETLRFQIRLEDDDWSAPTADLAIVYAGLGPGRYRFHVRAVSPAGLVSAQPATLAFVVPPPLWRSGWFGLLMASLLATLLAGIHRVRVRRVLELERVRTRIAADLHDDIGASLARVSLLSEAGRRALHARPDTADQILAEIGETARDLVTGVGDVAFCIDPGRGGLAAFLARVRRFGDELLAGTGICWEFTARGSTAGVTLSSDQRRHLLAIVKEGLHNAVRHGRPARVELAVEVARASLRLELRDDGGGFFSRANGCAPGNGRGPHSGAAASGSAGEKAAGHGLRSMRERARELGGRLHIGTGPAGTCLVVTVPLHRPTRMSMR